MEARCDGGMGGAERFFLNRQRALKDTSRRGVISLSVKHDGEIAESLRRIGMLRAENLLERHYSALDERPRRVEIALVSEKGAEIVEACRSGVMLGAENLLADCQRALAKRLGRSQIPPGPRASRRDCRGLPRYWDAPRREPFRATRAHRGHG